MENIEIPVEKNDLQSNKMTDKIEIKEIKKNLLLSSKIRISGKIAFGVTKRALRAIQLDYLNLKNKVNDKVKAGKEVVNEFIADKKDKIVDYAASVPKTFNEFIAEEKNEALEARDEKIQTEVYKTEDIVEKMRLDDDYRIGDNQMYLTEMQLKLKRLRAKQVKVSSKGLGLFAISKIAVSKFAKTRKEMLKKKLEESKVAIEENIKAREEARLNMENQQKEKDILSSYKDIVSQMEEYKAKTGIDLKTVAETLMVQQEMQQSEKPISKAM